MTQNKSVEEVVEEAKLAFYKRHAKQQYPNSLVTILDSFETEFKQALQQERQTSQEREREIVDAIENATFDVLPAPDNAKDFMGDYERGVVEGGYYVKKLVLDSIKEPQECDECGGTGKEICNNPDHGFIHSMPGDIGRLGCPCCGHSEDYTIPNTTCGKCKGTGSITLTNPNKD